MYVMHPKSNLISQASIADLITLLSSSVQNSEGSGDGDGDDSCADPCQFLPFPKTKI
jgi:hypothetical protein